MTSDHFVALSFVADLSRIGLADRFRAGDPTLVSSAQRFLDEARRVRAAAASTGIGVIAWNDPRYPASLLTLSDCPPAIWFRGRLETLDAPCIAIVGSRAATPGALETGTTVAVLGCGPDVIYPPEHKALVEQIAASGLLVSEYPPGTSPLPFHFPQRNRLISGLSRAVIVVEAAAHSGSLITAGCALEQGREVMAVPGSILSGRNRGSHALIRDGATIVEDVDDILAGLGVAAGEAETGPTRGHATTSDDPVLRNMARGQAYDLDTLSAVSGLPGPRLLPRLMSLEMRQLVRRVGGGRFMRSA